MPRPRMSKREIVEARFGAPIGTVLQAFAREGYEQRQVAVMWGVTTGCIRKWIRDYLPGWRWPCPESRLEHLRATSQRQAKRVPFRGRERSLAEIARLAGLHYDTVCKRYRDGKRGEALAAPPRHRGQRGASYRLGYSQGEWEAIADYARARTPEAARSKFGVPLGAVLAAVNEQWYRLD